MSYCLVLKKIEPLRVPSFTLTLTRFCVVCAFIFLSGNIYGQFDTIKFTNGSKQAAKITEISEKNVKYKNPRDTLGPTFVVRRKDVAGFVLKNGCLSMEPQGYVNCVKDPLHDIVKEDEFKRKIISLDCFQIANQHFQLNVDYIFKRKTNGIGIFLNLGLLDERDSETYKRIESSLFVDGIYKKTSFGIEYKFFPFAQKRFTNFCTLGFDVGSASQQIITTSVSLIGTTVQSKTYIDQRYYGYRFSDGFICRITKHVICQTILTLGVNQYSYENKSTKKNNNTFSPKISGSILWGYAF